MGILYCGDRPLTHGGAGIAGLRSSVGALRADNARLEALLGAGQPWTEGTAKYCITRDQYPGIRQMIRGA